MTENCLIDLSISPCIKKIKIKYRSLVDRPIPILFVDNWSNCAKSNPSLDTLAWRLERGCTKCFVFSSSSSSLYLN